MSSVILQKVSSMIHMLEEILIRHAATKEAGAEFLKRYALPLDRGPRAARFLGAKG